MARRRLPRRFVEERGLRLLALRRGARRALHVGVTALIVMSPAAHLLFICWTPSCRARVFRGSEKFATLATGRLSSRQRVPCGPYGGRSGMCALGNDRRTRKRGGQRGWHQPYDYRH